MHTSTLRPSPVVARPTSAADTACAIAQPVSLSAMPLRIIAGSPVRGSRSAIAESRHRLDHVVVRGVAGLRSGRAEADDRDVDEVRPRRPHRFVIDSERLRRRRSVVVHDDVGPVEQPLEHRTRLGELEVEHDRPLRSVEVRVVRGESVGAGAEVADRVATGRLELDHVGALIAEDHRAERPRHVRRDVEHLDAAERKCHRASSASARSRRAITMRWISLVPSPMHSSGASR